MIYLTRDGLQASKHGQLGAVKVLLSQGANMQARDKDEATPFHWAVQNGHTELSDYFISVGANVDLPAKYLSTPLHIAARQVRLLVVAIVRAIKLIVSIGQRAFRISAPCCSIEAPTSRQ